MAMRNEELTGRIIAAAIEVHEELGPGFLESIYQNAMEIELENRGIRIRAFEARVRRVQPES